MPRTPRIRSKSGIYHIMFRGTNRQEIFHDGDDCKRFLETMEKYKKESEISVFGWCLMGNHVHLLIQEGNEELAITVKRIGVSFVSFYNSKYKTSGHLFQDRFKSECVEENKSLLAVIRYIHQNPVKAGLVQKPIDWEWSSCRGYYNPDKFQDPLLDSDLILSFFSGKRSLFIKFNEEKNDDSYLDDIKKVRLTDDEARVEISKVIENFDIARIKTLPKIERDEIVARIKEVNGVTQRQISRMLGIPLALVSRAKSR